METLDNLSKYKIFLAVAECNSISKAAAQLYISQPAVSITIRKLEDNLNTTLFLRKSKGVELTENGRKLYENAKRAFQILSETEANLRFRQNTGYLRIAASNVLCKHFLMPYLKEFTMRYPNTEVSVTCTSSAAACSMVEQCKIDLALVSKPNSWERQSIIFWVSLNTYSFALRRIGRNWIAVMTRYWNTAILYYLIKTMFPAGI